MQTAPDKRMNNKKAQERKTQMRFEPAVSALTKWHPEIKAADDSDEATINIYSTVGESYFSDEGMTAKKVSDILKKNKARAVTVNINSPGGDFFEGTAIYNLLRAHDGDVQVRIVGMAASAAAIIAMAGKTIQIAESGFLMIHKAWTCMCGNANDMRELADVLDKFDSSQSGVFVKQTGMDKEEIDSMLAEETWMQGAEAVERNFATSLLEADDVALDEDEKEPYSSALRTVDIQLAKAGVPRSERRILIKDLTRTPSAADLTTPSAGNPEKETETEDTELLKALASLTKQEV